MSGEPREGEVVLGFDPGQMPPDAAVVFIGKVRSAWTSRADCPKNMAAAREARRPASVEVDAAWRAGLEGLAGYSHAILLTWLHESRRNLIVQKPRHADGARGVFALRSPVRPNPIGVHVVKLVSVEHSTGVVTIEAIDVIDGTPVIDIKPYFASADAVPDATRADR